MHGFKKKSYCTIYGSRYQQNTESFDYLIFHTDYQCIGPENWHLPQDMDTLVG